MKTRLVILSLLSMAFVGFTHANYSTSNSEYLTHDTSSLNFSATYTNGKVSMNRGSFTVPFGHTRQYRKVIRSSTNSNPVYPDDGYIYYGGSLSDRSYTDTNPSLGTNYYRVCAITQGTTSRHRYCSSVKTIKITSTSSSSESPTVTETAKPTTTTTATTTLTAAKKAVIDKLVANYMAKLNVKYTTDAQKITQLEKTIASVTAVKSSKLKAMYTYMAEKLNEELEALQLSDLLSLD